MKESDSENNNVEFINLIQFNSVFWHKYLPQNQRLIKI